MCDLTLASSNVPDSVVACHASPTSSSYTQMGAYHSLSCNPRRQHANTHFLAARVGDRALNLLRHHWCSWYCMLRAAACRLFPARLHSSRRVRRFAIECSSSRLDRAVRQSCTHSSWRDEEHGERTQKRREERVRQSGASARRRMDRFTAGTAPWLLIQAARAGIRTDEGVARRDSSQSSERQVMRDRLSGSGGMEW